MKFQMLSIPDAPKMMGEWQVRAERGDESLVEQAYPQVTITGHVKAEPHLTVTMALPLYSIIVPGGGLTVGRWDADVACWVQDGVANIEMVPTQGATRAPQESVGPHSSSSTPRQETLACVATIKFETFWLSHLAVLQSRTAAFPYESWRIEPLIKEGSTAVHSRVTISLHCGWQLHIRVSPRSCSLVAPAPAALQHFLDLECSAEELLHRLRAQGLNLAPVDEDIDLVLKDLDWHPPFTCPMGRAKDKVLEARVSRDMSMLAPVFVLDSSRYNHWCSASDAVVALYRLPPPPRGIAATPPAKATPPPLDPHGRGQEEGWSQVMWRLDPFPHVCMANHPCPLPPPCPEEEEPAPLAPAVRPKSPKGKKRERRGERWQGC